MSELEKINRCITGAQKTISMLKEEIEFCNNQIKLNIGTIDMYENMLGLHQKQLIELQEELVNYRDKKFDNLITC